MPLDAAPHGPHPRAARPNVSPATAARPPIALWQRRQVLQALAGLGIGTALFRRALAAQAASEQAVTAEMIRQAEWIADLTLSDEDRETTARAVLRTQRKLRSLREIAVDYADAPALVFQPSAAQRSHTLPPDRAVAAAPQRVQLTRPAADDELALLPVTELASLIRSRQVSSVELTRLYLARLRRYDPMLRCVVTLTEELAMRQAEAADREISAGRYRGPLHGIPWGAKDLIAHPDYKTTWGASPFRDQVIRTKAAVVRRLEEAGAVLAAKLSLGALAQGDRWFGGMTRNPWNPRQGSSGSSAGSSAAAAAGLTGFALGSETLGSIVSPCRRCGATGLRPTFGRVSRHGCMPLSWSMDKIGPIARSVEDCALVLAAIHGYDGLDAAAQDRPFDWPCPQPLQELVVGYFEDERPTSERPELQTLRDLGVQLKPISLPAQYDPNDLTIILNTEAAAVFDQLTRQGVTEGLNNWPDAFRAGQFTPAVEYLRANRIRSLLIKQMNQLMSQVDAYVGGDDLTLTNLTGHPTVVMPDGFDETDGVETPTAVTLTGRLFGESALLAIAGAYQQARGFHRRRPPLEKLLAGDDWQDDV